MLLYKSTFQQALKSKLDSFGFQSLSFQGLIQAFEAINQTLVVHDCVKPELMLAAVSFSLCKGSNLIRVCSSGVGLNTRLTPIINIVFSTIGSYFFK